MPALRVSQRISRYLHDTVVLVRFPGADEYQEPASATPETEAVRGRLEYERRKITDANGQEVIAEGLLFLLPETVLDFRDHVRAEGRDWRILRIDRLRDLRGAGSHMEVYLI